MPTKSENFGKTPHAGQVCSVSAKSTPIKSPEMKRVKVVPSSRRKDVRRSLDQELQHVSPVAPPTLTVTPPVVAAPDAYPKASRLYACDSLMCEMLC